MSSADAREAAIEAGARALFDADGEHIVPWEGQAEDDRAFYVTDATAVAREVAIALVAEAWRREAGRVGRRNRAVPRELRNALTPNGRGSY